jgi:AraC-like DNA-binding protein
MGLLTTLGAPLLLGYVTFAVRGIRLHWAWFLPFVAFAIGCLSVGPRLNFLLGTIPIILLEFAYTAVCWLVWLRYAQPRGNHVAVMGVLAAVTAIHVGQAASILDFLGYIGYRPIRQMPLVILCLWLATLLVMGLTHSPLVRKLAPAWTPSSSDADRTLFERIEKLMKEDRPWSDPLFDVGAMARKLDSYPNAVSRALGRAGNTTFYDYVNSHRIREAERLLTDPEESRFKIEAIGRQAGFRARSTFFKLFRQHTGFTPSEYRANRATSINA